eukprot:224039-Prymnesium_polylepis.2
MPSASGDVPPRFRRRPTTGQMCDSSARTATSQTQSRRKAHSPALAGYLACRARGRCAATLEPQRTPRSSASRRSWTEPHPSRRCAPQSRRRAPRTR